MPTLFTSLIARSERIASLAPKDQLKELPETTSDLAPKAHYEHVKEQYRLWWEGKGPRKHKFKRPALLGRTVAVVGAGLAGLSAAFELARRGYSVSVYEASDRVGGRTYSTDNVARPNVMDWGAELIGSNHPLWLFYSHLFHLLLTRVGEDKHSPVRINGKPLSGKQVKKLFHQMEEALKDISEQSKSIIDAYQPWTDPNAQELDEQTVYDFVKDRDWKPTCKRAVLLQLESDNGVSSKRQSLLGLLAMVRGGGMERYWRDTEVYRCKQGAMALSKAFSSALASMGAKIRLKSAVTGIDARGARTELQIDHKKWTEGFDDVVLAIPPTAWKTIDTRLPADLRKFMQKPPQMGRNIKALLPYRSRFWKRINEGPNVFENEIAEQTWETTEKDNSPRFGLVAFSGSTHAAKLSKMGGRRALAAIQRSLKAVYWNMPPLPEKAEFVNWPRRRWAWASYSFPNRGDITRWGPKFHRGYAGKLHFAGEHTCYAFTGYMEGALQSGYRLARNLVSRDGEFWATDQLPMRPARKKKRR
jgi:monoamine oxidase